ncbi:MAG: bifunctional 4-hydroxy-2-oxoglutarate aldolase/2-dehydro-3-deoxy-phosphogluconate aldolase [Caulobacteraceae bacterium]
MTGVNKIMTTSPVIPVLTVDDLASAGPLALALSTGGLRVLELTLRTPVALDALKAMVKAAPDAIVGAGTVLTADDLKRAVDAGAKFIVSPGLTKRLAKAAEEADVPLLPGVATATDIMRGLDMGLTRFKFFPAETSGGAAAIKAFGGPFGGVAFCPTGGITPKNAPTYLALPNVLCVGGTWIALKAAVDAGDWTQITELARQAAGLDRAGVPKT